MAGTIPDSANISLKINDSHCDDTHSSLTTDLCFGRDLFGKAASGLEGIVVGLLESMDRYTGCCCTSKMMLEMVLNIIQSTK